MAKQRSPIADYLSYLVLRLVICVMQALPLEWACTLARGVASLIHRLDRRHRDIALENLRHAFPAKYSAEQLDRLVYGVYEHLALLVVEVLFLPRRVNRRNWHRFIQYRNDAERRLLVRTMTMGRSVLLATGHFGNWEMSGHVLGLLGFQINAIARPLDNRHLDAFIRRFRQQNGQRMIAKNGELDLIQEVLARNGILGTLTDQDAGQRGLYVDFFNRPASTHKALALLALEHRVMIVVSAAVRDGTPLRYKILIEDVIYPEEYDGRVDAVKAITQRFTSALERMVREYPEQYFWVHRRWKHQPPVKKSKVKEAA